MHNNGKLCSPKYVLVTAAYNEERFIGCLIESVVAQTTRPLKWIIVSDGSTDRTDEIVLKNAAIYDFIELVRLTKDSPRDFGAGQARAIRTAYARLRALDFDFFGNLDADISLEPTYFSDLIQRFSENPGLGLAGGYIHERYRGKFKPRATNNLRSVPLGVQFFRRECYENIGGYISLPHGGSDWYAETCVRMKGWDVRSFPDLPVFHHRPTGSARNVIKHRFVEGKMDFSLGSDPMFELLKCIRRIPRRPFVIGAVSRLLGFSWSYVYGGKVLAPPEFVDFIRRDQRARVSFF